MAEDVQTPVSEDCLPTEFRNIIVENTESIARIRSNLSTLENIDEWVSSYGKVTNTQWIVRDTRPEAERFICRKMFVCHHSNYRKKPSKKKTKSLSCSASISIKIKINNSITRYLDDYIKLGLCGVIIIKKLHSHTLLAKSMLSALPSDELTRIQFNKYFDYGMGVAESHRYHEQLLELQDYSDVELLSGRLNPPGRRIQYWYDLWKHHNNCEVDVNDLLQKRLATYATKGIKILLHENPFAAVIVTPLMKRSHELKSSQEEVFVVSVNACDDKNHCVTFLFTRCPAGATPLAVIVTNEQSYDSFVAGFKLINIAVENGFGGQGFPRTFLTDNLPEEIKALQTVWPGSKNLLCSFRLCQDVWRWLWKAKNIPQGDKVSFMRDFQNMLERKNLDEAADSFKDLSLRSASYPNFSEYLDNYSDSIKQWCLSWRYDFSEISVKIFIDTVLSRVKPYNILALIDFCCDELENYYFRKFRQFYEANTVPEKLFLESLYKKINYLEPEDAICNGDEYFVPNEDRSEIYIVNVKIAVCSCPQGQYGTFCKHQCVIYKYFNFSENNPRITADDRYDVAALAFGENIPLKSYQKPLVIKIGQNFSSQDESAESPTVLPDHVSIKIEPVDPCEETTENIDVVGSSGKRTSEATHLTLIENEKKRIKTASSNFSF